MTKNWIRTEKAIAIYLILWGILMIALTIWSINEGLSLAFEHFNYTWDDISILKIIKNYHHLFVPGLMGIFSGITLLLHKKSGWMAGFLCSTTVSIHILISFITIEKQNLLESPAPFIVMGIIFLLSAIVFTLLNSKAIISKYKPTKSNWIVIGVLFTLLLIDRFFI